MRSLLLGLAAAGMLIGSGILHGQYTNRWGVTESAEGAVERLNRIPARVGDWQAEEHQLAADEVRSARLLGYVARRYTNPRLRQSLSVLLVFGPSGPVVAHVPEVCYQGNGFAIRSPAQQVELPISPGEQASFQVASFRKANEPTELRVGWAWRSLDGGWEAPSNPRWALARHRFLYKMYVVRSKSIQEDSSPTDDVGAQFLREFLPVVEQDALNVR
ncbi:hypothetical protein AYO40_03715 [Planctomycetaceae bacterium SCGC AG-212-D15]|nr:hypothetical protein AYO40_03715 [Planctomycetaceae bacterium SCGC AG-212-D15]